MRSINRDDMPHVIAFFIFIILAVVAMYLFDSKLDKKISETNALVEQLEEERDNIRNEIALEIQKHTESVTEFLHPEGNFLVYSSGNKIYKVHYDFENNEVINIFHNDKAVFVE